jgi:hypothetical protein
MSVGYFAQGSHHAVNKAMDDVIKKLRPQMIPLVEAFGYPDEVVPSAIGNSYGDIYET